jgi:hypothetical protein
MTVPSDTSDVMQSLREYRAIREEILRDHRGCFEASQSEFACLRKKSEIWGGLDLSGSNRFFARTTRAQRADALLATGSSLIALLLLWRVIAGR